MTSAKPAKLPVIFLANGGKFEPWHCHRCGNPVRSENAVVLEESCQSAEIHDFGMPEDESGGLLLFGKNCATQLRKRARLIHGSTQDTKVVQQAMLERLGGKHKAMNNNAYGECLREVLEAFNKN